MKDKSKAMQAALDAAEAARGVIMGHYAAGVDVRFKGDDSPVTQADVEAEEAIVSVLRERFPDHGFFGEELGQHNTDSAFTWLIDPIDGTKSFVRNCPFFSTQIALMHDGKLVLGVSSAPATAEVFYAERGQGAWCGDARLQVRSSQPLERAVLSTGNLGSLIAQPAKVPG